MALSSYLVRRANTYYFRARNPADIAAATGRPQVVMSLKATDLRIAKVAAARIFLSLASIYEKIRVMIDAEFPGRTEGLTRAQRLAQAMFALGRDYESQQSRLRAEFDERLRLLSASLDDREFASSMYTTGDHGNVGVLEFLGQGSAMHHARSLDAHGPEQVAPAVSKFPGEAQSASESTPSPIVALMEQKRSVAWHTLKADFFADKPGLSKKTKWSYDQAFRDWQQLIAHKAIGAIKRVDVKCYANHLRDRKNPRGGNLDRQTIIKSLGHVKTFLEWAVANGYVEDDSFALVKVRDKTLAEKLSEPRRAFSVEELTRLFHSDVVRYPRNRKDWSWRWFLLVALLSGGRTEELATAPAQLINVGRFACLDLRAASKTAAAPRLVPVCLDLLHLGFVEYAGEQAKKGYLLFQQDRVPKTAGAWSSALNRFINDEISNDPSLTLYSLRHNFRQSQRAANLNEELSNKTFGHSSGKVGEGYGKKLSDAEAALFIRVMRSPISFDFLIER
jgi:site-specific recombinase XerD